MKLSGVLPDHLLRLMSPEDRRALGVAGWTREEVEQRAQIKNERELQKQIVNYLRLHGIEPLWFRTDKRTTANLGWPDITFSVEVESPETYRSPVTIPCVWEIKFEKGRLSKQQDDLSKKLITYPNGWRYRIITSLDEAIMELRELGIEAGT